jgi:hypothetical protein
MFFTTAQLRSIARNPKSDATLRRAARETLANRADAFGIRAAQDASLYLGEDVTYRFTGPGFLSGATRDALCDLIAFAEYTRLTN